jgi:hypothetical protein
MIIIRFSKKRLKAITREGIQFMNDKGQLQYIDFQTCRKNWVAYVNESDDFETTHLSEAETTCVGVRNVLAKPIYIEFFTDNLHIKFEFHQVFLGDSALKQYHYLKNQVVASGWSLLDLT